MANDDTIVQLKAEISDYKSQLTAAGKLTDNLTAKVKDLDKALVKAQGTSGKPIGPKSSGVGVAGEAMAGLRASASQASGAAGAFAGLAKVGAVAASVFVLAEAIQKVGTAGFDAARQTENLTAQLKALTGSGALAAQELARLQDISFKLATPIEEVTNTFVRLKRGGFDPTAEAMQSFGNIAAGSGKTLGSFMEAITDAKMGEFERLKEFMIDGSKAGDKFRFTFNGVTTEVDKNAIAMQKYFETLGDTSFKGALEEQSKTIDGVLTKLGGATTRYLNMLAQGSGIIDTFKRAMLGLSEAMMDASETDVLKLQERELAGLEKALQRLETNYKNKAYASELSKEKMLEDIAATRESIGVLREQIGAIKDEDKARADADKSSRDARAAKAEADKKALELAEDQKKSADDMAKQAKGVIEDLKKELATREDLTKEIGLAYDLESGRFKDLKGPLRDEIEQLIRKKDAMVAINEQHDIYSKRNAEQAEASRQRDKDAQEVWETENERAQLEADEANKRIKRREEQDEQDKARVRTMFDFQNASDDERKDFIQNHEKAVTKFRQMSMSSQANIVTKGLMNITSAMSQHSKAFFQVNKISGIANAVINTAQGVTEALKAGPAGIPAAAMIAAEGLAQILTIKGTSFGSGGNVKTPSGGSSGGTDTGGGAPSFSEAGNKPPLTIRVTLRDDEILNGEGLRNFIRRITDEAGDMGYRLAI